jgi:hypothetical protein
LRLEAPADAELNALRLAELYAERDELRAGCGC